MLKLKNIKLNTVFITGLVLILGSSMIFLAFAAVESIISLGAYATNEVEEVITKQASELFLTKTRYKANEYSLIFLDAAKLAKVYGNQVAFIYENIDKFNFDKKILTTYQNKFFRKIAKGNLYNKTKSNIYTVYAGKEKKVPLKIAKLSFLLSFLNPLFKNIDNSSDIYLDVFLMIFNDNLLVNYQKGDELSFLKFAKDERAYLISAKKETLDGGRTELEVSPPSKPQAGNIILTCGYRRFDLAGKLIIYAGIDISLLSLTKKILKINKSISKTKENIFSFIFDKKNRKIIACPKYLVNASKFETDIYNRQVFIGNKNYAAVVSIKYKDMIDPSFFKEINIKSKLTKNGILHTSYKNKKYIAAFSRMKFNDWVLCTAVPVDLLLKPVNKTRNMMKSTISGFKMNFMFLSGFFLMISILLIVIFFRKYLIIPIVKFRNRAVKMGEGNFGASVLLEGTSEIKDLGLSFNSLGGELRTYMKNVEKEIAKKTKVENEVKVARQIQQAILPRITNTYKNIGIELFAELHPAKDVAGDFYDFFFLSDNKMVILIADVSGKGISAAFFMSIAKRVLRNVCTNEPDDPAEALKITNEILASHNINMFVTIFLIYYELNSGKIKYANAGHNELLLVKASGEHEYIGCLGDTVAGFLPDLDYNSSEIILNPGETLVLYTDGVTEANSPSEEEYGENRLAEFIVKNQSKIVKEVVQELIADVHDFEQGGQFDDITVVMFRRK